MRARALRAVVSVALACALALIASSSAGADTIGMHSTVCTGTATIGFLHGLGRVPSQAADTVTLTTPTPLDCSGLLAGQGTIDVSGTTVAGTSCTGALGLVGGGTVTLPGPVGQVNTVWVASGSTTAQSWAFVDSGGKLEATGAGVLEQAADAASCVTSGSATGYQLTAALVIVA